MLELGYMSNPLEYEAAADKAQIERFAAAAADAIEGMFK
jgi:N-acetylmuramoyl-L-alanine amidase